MSEVDKDLSERYRGVSRAEPPADVDAVILAAAKRAVGSRPQPLGASRALRRWYLPVSLAAVIMLSVLVTLHVERERPDSAMQDAVPVARQKAQEQEQQQKPAESVPASPPPASASDRVASRAAPKTAPPQPPAAAAPQQPPAALPPAAAPAPAFVPDPQPARDAAVDERRRNDAPRSADAAQTAPSAAAEAGATLGRSAAAEPKLRSEAREMAAPAAKPAPSAALAKRELAPAEWLERIAELRALRRDQEADEQLAEFKRRYPDYKIPEAMTERIAPRK